MNGYNFTERVRKSLAFAREEAGIMRHEYVGTEHLLLGLLHEGGGVAMAVLGNLKIEPGRIRHAIEEVCQRGKAPTATGPDLPYTSRAKKVLELAMTEARSLGHSYVGTEHLLLGLLREEKGIAAQVLVSLGVTLERARVEVKATLEGAEPRRFDHEPPREVHVVGTAKPDEPDYLIGTVQLVTIKGSPRLLLTISAIPAWLIGLMLIFNAKAFEATMGISVDDWTETIAQAQGALLLGIGFVNWLARGINDRPALWAILYGNFVVHAVSFAIVLRALVQDLMPASGLAGLTLHALFAAAFGWQALQVRRAR
jgi:hypothetical protein